MMKTVWIDDTGENRDLGIMRNYNEGYVIVEIPNPYDSTETVTTKLPTDEFRELLQAAGFVDDLAG